MSTVTNRTTAGSRTSTALTALRVIAALATVALLYQFASAGQVLMHGDEVLEYHGAGAIALHVLTGLLTLAAFWHRRTAGGPWWPTALSALAFVVTFVTAWYGNNETLWIHVPLALILTVGTVWVTAWAFTPFAASPVSGRR